MSGDGTHDETAGTIEPRVLRVVSGSPTADELGAITAVLAALEAAEASRQDARRVTPAAPSAWDRSRRALRTPLESGPGRWRGFSA